MENNYYRTQRRNAFMRIFRIRLGFLQLIHKPFLNLILLPIVISTLYFWKKRNAIICLFDTPDYLFQVYKYSVLVTLILLPAISLLIVIAEIGYFTARKDEADLQEAFGTEELRNGFPILISKRRVRKSNVLRREFYTEIPKRTWEKRREDIEDSMNVTFVGPIEYGGKGNGRRIVMHTRKGRKRPRREEMYDE